MHVVIPSLFVLVDQRCDLLAEGIEHGQGYVRPVWQPVAYHRGGVEGVGVILFKSEKCRHLIPGNANAGHNL